MLQSIASAKNNKSEHQSSTHLENSSAYFGGENDRQDTSADRKMTADELARPSHSAVQFELVQDSVEIGGKALIDSANPTIELRDESHHKMATADSYQFLLFTISIFCPLNLDTLPHTAHFP